MRSLELFAGAGGMGIGLHLAGFHPSLVIERDRYCCDTIRENKARAIRAVKGWRQFEGDIRDVRFSKFKGRVKLVSGGPPCQPFSLGGQHRGDADSRDMFPQAIRAVREAQPKAFIFENVKGLTRDTFRNYFEYVRLQLQYPELEAEPQESQALHLARLERHHTAGNSAGLQYRVVAQVVNAADYGVPQRRERVFIVGFRTDVGIGWSFPEPTHSLEALLWEQAYGDYWDRHSVPRRERHLDEVRKRVRSSSSRPEALPWRTVRDAINDLPDPESEPLLAGAFLNHRFQPGARSYYGHTGSPWDRPAKALKAGVHGVPGGENTLRRSDGTVRYFTVRECARLQTFPDDFLFHGSWTETMRQLGNAVPVRLAQTVGESVARYLEKAR